MASQGSGCDVEENELDDAEMEEKDELGNLSGIANRRPPFRVGGFASEAGTSSSRNHHRFLDRSKVRILLCDGDEKSSREVSELLCKCSYQVVSVRTARQVINALNAQGSEIDIILSEVDLPVAKGFKMLKYIMRTKELRHIPIVMMSAKDEVSVVVKCLRLGVADYLVKPLRTNELLNLWIHMWRRRRMLDLAEKDIWSYDIDTLVSDMSDGNTNSTLVSDDTDDRSRTVLVEMVMSKRQEFDVRSKNSAVDVEPDKMSKLEFDVQEEDKSMSGRILSCPKKNELKVGKSSAFLTYVKSRSQMKNSADVPLQSRSNERDLVSYDEPGCVDKHGVASCQSDGDESVHQGRSSLGSFPTPADLNPSEGQSPFAAPTQAGDLPLNISGDSQVYQLPCFFPRTMTQNLVHPCPSVYHGGLPAAQLRGSPVGYTPLMPCARVPVISSFPYYPVALGTQPEQVPSPHLWTSIPCSSTIEVKSSRVERREAALLKFRLKRKDRCFDKKIRYVNRKRLAERRPRVRGQFVRKLNGVSGDLNECPTGDAYFEDEEDDDEGEEESVARDGGLPFSPEHEDCDY